MGCGVEFSLPSYDGLDCARNGLLDIDVKGPTSGNTSDRALCVSKGLPDDRA